MPRNRFMILMIIFMVISFMAMDGGRLSLFGKELSHNKKLFNKGIVKRYAGFFAGFKGDTISIIDSKSNNLSSFKVSPSVRVINKGDTIEKTDIIIHSMVILIVINNIVEEIIAPEEGTQ